MNSLFYTVAILCQINIQVSVGLDDISAIEKKQLECQKHYASCIKKSGIFTDWTLAKCILEKK